MKRLVVLSFAVHLLVLGGLAVADLVWSRPVTYTVRRVYEVELVTLPADRDLKRRTPQPPDPHYQVVPKKEAAVPQTTAEMAVKRTPRRVIEKPEETAARPSFETDTPGVKLDTEDFEFPYYLAVIQRKIQQNLVVPQLAGVSYLRTTMYFRIARSGQIYAMEMEESSNNPIFDNAVRRALLVSNPLPPLPDGYKRESLGVHFEFEYVR